MNHARSSHFSVPFRILDFLNGLDRTATPSWSLLSVYSLLVFVNPCIRMYPSPPRLISSSWVLPGTVSAFLLKAAWGDVFPHGKFPARTETALVQSHTELPTIAFLWLLPHWGLQSPSLCIFGLFSITFWLSDPYNLGRQHRPRFELGNGNIWGWMWWMKSKVDNLSRTTFFLPSIWHVLDHFTAMK